LFAEFLEVGQPQCAGERTVAADDDQPLDTKLSQRAARTIADLALVKLPAPSRPQDRPTFAQDAGDVGRPQRSHCVVEQSAIPALDTENFDAGGMTDQRDRSDRRVHPGGVAAAGQDCYSLDRGHVVVLYQAGRSASLRSSAYPVVNSLADCQTDPMLQVPSPPSCASRQEW
jgi:hypothetical protein